MLFLQGKYKLLWVVLMGIYCAGQYHQAQAVELDALIDKIQHTYEQTPAFTADFVQVSTLTSIQRQQTSSGRVYINKPHAIRWEYLQPDSQTILYDGTVLRIYTPKRRQLLQSVIDEGQRSNVALLFLAGVGISAMPLPSPLSPVQNQAWPISVCSLVRPRQALQNCILP
jgi:outer membrane lipoprotein-sorting protein